MQGKERVIWGIWNGLKKHFWGRSDQSNDEINLIPAHLCRVCDPCLIGLKTGMDFRGQVWKRPVGKRHFFWSVLGAHPQQNLPKVTTENCRFLNSLLHNKVSKSNSKGIFRTSDQLSAHTVHGLYKSCLLPHYIKRISKCRDSLLYLFPRSNLFSV